MSQDIRNISELAPNIPNIVITEPSPFAAANSTIPARNYTPSSTAASPNTSPSETQSTVISITPTSEKSPAVTSEVFKPTENGDHRTVQIDEQAAEVSTVDGTTDEVLASSDDVPAEEAFRNRPVDRASECLSNWSSFINSKYVLPVLVLLLAIPISAGYMGARYMDKCPMSSATPIFLFMMGVAGCLVIFCRMIVVLKDIFSSRETEWDVFSTIAIFGNLAILLCLCTEIVMFFRVSPDFYFGASNYCHQTFYTYTYWMNWISVLVVLLIAVFHAPKCRFIPSRIEREP